MTTPTPRQPECDPLRFDRSDRWALTALLGTWVLVTLWTGVVDPVRRWVGGGPAHVEVSTPVTAPVLEGAGAVDGPGRLTLEVPVDGVGLRLAELLPGVLAAGLVLVGAWVALRVMRTIAAGDPFAPANVTRLRLLAGLLILGSAVLFFADLSVSGALLGSLEVGTPLLESWTAVPWPAVIAGMVVALVAEAFKAGSRLRDDVEGLV